MHFGVKHFQQLAAGVRHALVNGWFHGLAQRGKGGVDLRGRAAGAVDVQNAPLDVHPGFDAAQHFVGCAKHAVEQFELDGQQLQHAGVGVVAFVEKVDDHHVVLLAVAVAAANALLHALGVPGQVVVDDE